MTRETFDVEAALGPGLNGDAIESAAEALSAFCREVEERFAASGRLVACAAGCAWCCHWLVSVAPAEAFRIARWVEETLSAEEALAIRRAVAAAPPRDALAPARCAFLSPEDVRCRIYPARPFTCRGMNAVDAAPCRAAVEEGEQAGIPTIVAHHRAVTALYDALAKRAAAGGLTEAVVELIGALRIVWETADAEARWLAGEDVFAAVRVAGMIDDVPRFE